MTTEIIAAPNVVSEAKRIIADSLARQAEVQVPYSPNADKKTSHKDILATMLWDIVLQGYALLADGNRLVPEDYGDWLATVKYLVTHLDGPVGNEGEMGTNVFKVYVGVNVDKI